MPAGVAEAASAGVTQARDSASRGMHVRRRMAMLRTTRGARNASTSIQTRKPIGRVNRSDAKGQKNSAGMPDSRRTGMNSDPICPSASPDGGIAVVAPVVFAPQASRDPSIDRENDAGTAATLMAWRRERRRRAFSSHRCATPPTKTCPALASVLLHILVGGNRVRNDTSSGRSRTGMPFIDAGTSDQIVGTLFNGAQGAHGPGPCSR